MLGISGLRSEKSRIMDEPIVAILRKLPPAAQDWDGPVAGAAVGHQPQYT
jgi:hypothetical protein